MMENAKPVHSPTTEELEAYSVRRFEAYQAIKTEHEQRKDDLKQNLEREERRINDEVQEAKPRLEEQLEVHKRIYAAAIEDESQKYHSELKEARRTNSPETRPEHTLSIEKMEAEETRLFQDS
ncbi:hypothetical protein VSDG_02206 [Cytospora chrysosperma]|uniref:Uncharacterized protein n=1 Tax=Cytospora chrysosperma TaxID=252740 RepID=A0A423WEA8_CYTCH|nr:hypothetical protein VSDG_02206 [Valsa sordida]